MGYAAAHQPSVLELARSGNPKAIAYWLNVFLLPHNLFAQVNSVSPTGCVQVLVEFHPSPEVDAKSPEFRKNLMRFICHHFWKLNSEMIEGVQVITRFIGTPQVLWKQTVRVMSPARRAKLEEAAATVQPDPEQLKTRIRQVTRQRVQFRALRSLLLTGTTAAAFIIGCWLGYADAPSEQTTASANATSEARPDTVKTALETISVQKPEISSSDGTATLMFAGDVALTNTYAEMVGTDNKWAFSALDEVRQADITMVNLESPFTSATTPNPNQSEPFKADPAKVEVLKNGGIDLVNLANSRAMDYQAAGLEETLKTLDQAGIRHVGAGRDAKEARRPTVMDVDGQRIAYLGYYDSDLQAAGATQAGTNFRDRERIASDIKALRDQVDWVVVNFHWGEDISKYPAEWQIELAHHTIDQGADLVVGHHSSVLQGAEIYKGRPIVYSLGNFIFGGAPESDYDTAMLKVALKDKQMKVELLPVEVKGFQPRVVSGDRGKEILQQIAGVSDGFQKPLGSSVVIDARSNTTLSEPEALPTESAAPSDFPSEEPSEPSSEIQPTETPSESSSEIQPTETPSEETQPIEQSSEATPSPESSSTESFIESPNPESQPAESPVFPDRYSQPEPSPTPTESPDPSAQPWNGNSFIDAPNASPTPIVPQPELSPAPESPSGAVEVDQGSASIPSESSPVTSLEPIQRQYAESVPATTQAFPHS